MAADTHTLLLHVFLTLPLLKSWLLSKALSSPKASMFHSNIHPSVEIYT